MAAAGEDEDFVLEEDEYDEDNNRDYGSDKSKALDPNATPIDPEAVCSGQSGIKGRGWAGNLQVPTWAPKVDQSAPKATLALEWVYGYRGYDSWGNVMFNDADPNGDLDHIVYPCAGVNVVYDSKKHTQRLFAPTKAGSLNDRHNDDIICLAQNPVNKNVFASGQVASIVDGRSELPKICVWDSTKFDSEPKSTLVIPNAGERSILALGFSSDGNLLGSVGCDDNFTIKIFNVASGSTVPIASKKGGTSKIYRLEWSPVEPTKFVTVGIKHIYFWTFDGVSIKGEKANMGKMPLQTFYSVTWTDKGYCCVGTRDGSIYVFVNGECKKVLKNVHKGKTYALFYHSSGDGELGGLVSGGSDGTVVCMDKKLNVVNTIQVETPVKSLYVRVAQNQKSCRLLIGTSSQIFLFDNFLNSNNTSLAGQKPLVEGHWDGEVWGLDVHPSDPSTFATVGDDNTIFIWDNRNHQCVRRGPINSKLLEPENGDEAAKKPFKKGKASTTSQYGPSQCARSLSYSTDGSKIVIGCNNGVVQVHDAKSLKLLHARDLNKCSKPKQDNDDNWIQVIKHSPNGRVCAVGTHGAVIVLLDATRDYEIVCTLGRQENSAAVTFMDWSEDSTILRTNTLDYKLDFWCINLQDLKSSSKFTGRVSEHLKDLKTATDTGIIGWSVDAIFEKSQDGSDINTVDRSHNQKLLVTGDDYGWVNVFRWPCYVKRADYTKASLQSKHNTYEAHSSHVMCARFTADDAHVLTAGGGDKAVMQWRVQDD